jgi:hypothetical protein
VGAICSRKGTQCLERRSDEVIEKGGGSPTMLRVFATDTALMVFLAQRDPDMERNK